MGTGCNKLCRSQQGNCQKESYRKEAERWIGCLEQAVGEKKRSTSTNHQQIKSSVKSVHCFKVIKIKTWQWNNRYKEETD